MVSGKTGSRITREEWPKHGQCGRGFVEEANRSEIAARALRYLDAGLAVCFCGPAGTGKTALARRVAQQRGRPIVTVVGDADLRSSDLLGSVVGEESQETRDRFVHSVMKNRASRRLLWRDGPLLTAMQTGSTLLYDEYTRASASANNPLLSAIEDQIVMVPTSGRDEREVSAAAGFGVIMTANPEDYAGTNPTADALLDRLVLLKIPLPDINFRIGVVAARTGLTTEDARRVVEVASRETGRAGGSLRRAIMIASVCASSGIVIDPTDRAFTALCDDVLGPPEQVT